MITLERPAFYDNNRYAEYCGLSGDDKATIDAKNGDEFYEIDTAKKYKYNADTAKWVEQPTGGGSAEASVVSVNGKTGTVVLSASDVGALSNTTAIPSNVVQYTTQTLTDNQKAQARTNIGAGTSSFSGSYADLTNKPTIPSKMSELTNDSGFITATDIAENNEFSTLEEKAVGKWVDGRTIYRMTFNWTASLATNKQAYYHGTDLTACNIDQYIRCYGIASCTETADDESTITNWQPIPRVSPDAPTEYSIGFGDLDTDSIGILFGTKYIQANIYFTIEYVKAE